MASHISGDLTLEDKKWPPPQFKWACTRLAMQIYTVFCLVTVIGGGITYPLATYFVFGDFRFWRYLRQAPKLWFFLVRGAWRLLRDRGHNFMFEVPLTAPPSTFPDLKIARLRDDWPHGRVCEPCTRCCTFIRCPAMDPAGKGCLGFDSPLWRYLNCGRFPTSQKQLDYYGCPKWEMR